MTAKKYSASMNDELLNGVTSAARAEGVTVSAWLARAAEDRLALLGLPDLIADWEAEHGEITAEELSEARARLLRPQTASAKRSRRAKPGRETRRSPKNRRAS